MEWQIEQVRGWFHAAVTDEDGNRGEAYALSEERARENALKLLGFRQAFGPPLCSDA